MISFKRGVDVSGITKECIAGMCVAAKAHISATGRIMVVTSVCDGKHMKGSKHYGGNAFDVRTWIDYNSGVQMSPDTKHDIAVRLVKVLGKDWDVVIESTHIHIEYDPK